MTKALNLHFPSNLDPSSVATFVRSLTIRPNDRLLRPSRPLAFTVTASKNQVQWRVEVEPADEQLVLGQLRAHLPNVRTEADERDGSTDDQSERRDAIARLGVELRVSSSERPLRSDVAEELARGLLGVFQDVRSNESINVQWMLGPPLPRRVRKPEPNTTEQTTFERIIYPPRLDAEEARAANQKQSEPLFGVVGRIAVQTPDRKRRRSLMNRTLGILRLSSAPSAHLIPRQLISSRRSLKRFDARSTPLIEWPCILNATEFAVLLGWPIGGPVSSGVVYSGRRELPFSDRSIALKRNTPTDDRPRPNRPQRVLGMATHPSRTGLVVQSPGDALQHTHIIGPTGVGKSTLLTNLALADINAGRGVVVIEPKGDVIRDLLDRIPPERHDDVVLLDPSNTEQIIGLELFNSDQSNSHGSETAVDALVHLLRSQFSSSWGPRTQDILTASLHTLAGSKVNGQPLTLVDLPLLLGDAHFRGSVISELNHGRSDAGLASFWGWYESLSDAQRAEVIAPVMNKVRAFTLRSSMRRILGQSNAGLKMMDVFTRRRIVLVALKPGEIGPQMASVLGGLVIAKLWQAAQSRTAISPDRRHPVMVYLDEFQNYLHLPTNLSDVLAQARGLGLGMTLAHQHLGQLAERSMRSAVMQNARSRIVFQSGSEDASTLAKSLGGGLEPSDITALGRFEAYAQLMVDGQSTAPGSLATLPLPDATGQADHLATQSLQRYGHTAERVDKQISERQRIATQGQASKAGGRRRRSA